jgi:hypothetical protein
MSTAASADPLDTAAPPVLLFTVLDKYFSTGGMGGSLAGQ